ncbi:MAG: hypothetical protein QW314_00405 [Thermoproteota archaeon]|nr:hypothetical protein [Candidatus Brockarchaeota archaeon]
MLLRITSFEDLVKMKILGVIPTLTAFTFIYILFSLLIVKEATNIYYSINIVKRFNIEVNETSKSEQIIDKKVKEGISTLENKTIKSSELSEVIDSIFKNVIEEFSKNNTKVSYVFNINSIKVSSETYKVKVKYKINVEVTEQYFYIRSWIEGEKDVTVNLLEDFAQN